MASSSQEGDPHNGHMHTMRETWAVVFICLAAGASLIAEPAGPGANVTSTRPATGRAVILDEPDMPIRGARSSPRVLARILEAAGLTSRLVSADELADPRILDAKWLDLVVLPTGRSFPSPARDPLIRFLHSGGGLITMGGYAFNHLVTKDAGRWNDENLLLAARFEAATQKEKSLLSNGDFEASQTLAESGRPIPGQWQSSGRRCTIVAEMPQEGSFCARTVIDPTTPSGSEILWQDLPAQAGAQYLVSGWMKTDQVLETGMAFIALYQYGAADKPVAFKDFAKARGTTGWSHHRFMFTAEPNVSRLHIKCGLYQTRGTAWFDDIRLADVSGTQVQAMNTSSGRPADGLICAPEQIGMFDASFPLKRARSLGLAPGQHVIREPIDVRRDLAGWAAAGVAPEGEARWIPLLATYDRYGRARGPAAALLLHHAGYYAGSCWGYFGVENVDLFEDTGGPMARALQQLAGFIVRKTYLRNLTTDHRLYRSGEPVNVSVFVENQGRRTQQLQVRFTLGAVDGDHPLAAQVEDVRVGPHASVEVRGVFLHPDGGEDLGRVTAVMTQDGMAIDEMTTGFVIDRPDAEKAGLELRFENNYFTVNGRPLFLFGTDTYAYTYKSVHENPLTWSQEHEKARDMGVNLYENLQYVDPGDSLSEEDWRSFRAMSRLTQLRNLIFMPGMLIGRNVAVGDDRLARQSALCRSYAEHLGDTPGLLYYINGDYQMMLEEHAADVKVLWNRWLQARYGTTERLRTAWAPAAVTAELGWLAFPPAGSGRWNDVVAVDRLRFQNGLTRRWNETHVAAVRERDRRHPITSEYYQIGWAGLDLPMTIDGQDVSNFGFFDLPENDLDILPLKIRSNDLRARGKGVSLGEYGVKTHPAWTVENGATDYHIVRTEEQQIQLFLAVAHYALGMGASKIQHWCLRDDQTQVFPWGIFYPHEFIPKDVAYAHRNQSLIWRQFAPRYVPPQLTVCTPCNLRLGNDERLGRDVVDRACDTLLGLHHQFNVIDDQHLEQLPPQTRVIVYPAPFAVSDAAYARLLAWVQGGGTLLVTGDVSYDEDRQRTRTARLRELAGVDAGDVNYPDIERRTTPGQPAVFSFESLPPLPVSPCVQLKVVDAEVLGRASDSNPVLLRRRLGKGWVYLFTDPTELSADARVAETRRQVYAAFLRVAGVVPLDIQPDEPWMHVMAQPTARGFVHVVFSRRRTGDREKVSLSSAAGRLTLTVRNRWPGLAAVTKDGKVVAVNATGSAAVDGKPLMSGEGMKALLSLDGRDLRDSESILVAPFASGTLELPARSARLVASVGEFRNGCWKPLERINLDPRKPSLDIDGDRATCLILLCGPGAECRWAEDLTNAMLHPDQIDGY